MESNSREKQLLWTELCLYPLQVYIEAPDPNVSVFGERNFVEVTGVRGDHRDEALVQWDWCPWKKGRHARSFCLCVHREEAA